MKQIATTGIVLQRTNYGEADRILTILTPDHGKLRLIAKGVRKINAKLAGGIELFSVSSVTFISGKGDMGTMISARLDKHYDQIAKDIDRTMLGYDLIKQINRITEDEAEQDWYDLLHKTLAYLDDNVISMDVIKFWFLASILRISGYTPNLQQDAKGEALDANKRYRLDESTMSFNETESGTLTANHIKLLRLAFDKHEPLTIQKIKDTNSLIQDCVTLLQNMIRVSLRI